jgi:hypothetical protein
VHLLRILFSATASFLAILSYYPYIKGILKGKTKPNRATFLIWTVIGVVEIISYLASGGGLASGLLIAYTVGTGLIFVMSIKYGVGGGSLLDITCLLGALVGVLGWVITKNPHVALSLSIIAGMFGYLPTFKKVYLTPKTENTSHWVLCGVAAVFNIFAISKWSLFTASAPVYLLICDGALALLTLFPKALRQSR